jgi:hypothetical protein
MNVTYAQKSDTDFIVNSKLNREYSIVYHRSNYGGNCNNSLITVKNRREVELLLLTLREEASVVMDVQDRKLCELWDWLYGRTYADILTDLKWSYRGENEVVEIIGRIPPPRTLLESYLRNQHDPEPERIKKEFVHKLNEESVLISKPHQSGNMFYFYGFNKSSEFNIDHSSDHVEGIIIFEAIRQAGFASLHLAGVPLSSMVFLLNTTIQYKRFIEHDKLYLIHSIPVLRQRGGHHYVVFNVLQNGNSCATGFLAGLLPKEKKSHLKRRKPRHTMEVSNEKAISTR